MDRIRRIAVWLRRWRYCQGFGVQSPWAYRFIRCVVNEHNPYYAYQDLKNQFPSLPSRTLRLCRLYFRIANFRQPAIVLDYGRSAEAYKVYVKAGCRKADFICLDDSPCIKKVEMLRLSLTDNYREVFEKAVEVADENTLIILEQIMRDAETKAFWKSVVADERCVTTFDLYYCGIIFFDKKRYKENYIVNF